MNRILVAAAVLPALAIILYVIKADKLEKEPMGLIAKLVLAGVLATVLALITETVGQFILNMISFRNSKLYSVILFFFVVGLSEEGFKFLLLKAVTWKNPDFNCRFDGVVYSVCVALGFAVWENLAYVANYGLSVAIARAVTAVPGHACFGVFMGAFYSAAKGSSLAGDQAGEKRYKRMALIVPLAVHGLYDYVASAQTSFSAIAFIVLIAAVFFFAFRILKRMSITDGYFTRSFVGSDDFDEFS